MKEISYTKNYYEIYYTGRQTTEYGVAYAGYTKLVAVVETKEVAEDFCKQHSDCYYREYSVQVASGSSFISTYNELTELFESESEYKDKLDLLTKNKGIISSSTAMTIEFYETENSCPVLDFLEAIQDQKLKEKTVKNIYNLSEFGLDLNKTKNSSYVEDGIYELRTKQGNNIDRIFYFFVIGNKIILTNGYIKKTEKVDKAELKRAKQYRDNYSRQM